MGETGALYLVAKNLEHLAFKLLREEKRSERFLGKGLWVRLWISIYYICPHFVCKSLVN